MQSIYICPKTGKSLEEHNEKLTRADGIAYPIIKGKNNSIIPNFISPNDHSKAAKESLAMYDQKVSTEIYRNFLDWLFQTFNEDEASFRANLIAKLNIEKGDKILITGCGLGDDIPQMIEAIGPEGKIYANDLASEMVIAAANNIITEQSTANNVLFSVCNAQSTPFPSDFFDGAFHFGGINLFDDIQSSIKEMERVVKPGGRVVFGDESVAPWLRDTEYSHIAINNNSLWGAPTPINLLPQNSVDVNLSWVLGNCFYVIDFEVSEKGPFMDINVKHKGFRGGTMKSRYFGQLEGVCEESKQFVLEDAARKEISVHDWLEEIIKQKQNYKDLKD